MAANGAQPGSHSGFYAPVVAVICPCKGTEPDSKKISQRSPDLTTRTTKSIFRWPRISIPRFPTIERVKAASPRPVHIVDRGRHPKIAAKR